MKSKLIWSSAVLFGALSAVAANYDLEYESADGWVQVEHSTTSLATALNGVKPDGTIRLLDDVTVGSDISGGSEKSYVLDGQGHTVTIATGRFSLYASGAFRVLTYKNLTLTATVTQTSYLGLTEYRGTIIFDNVILRDYANTNTQVFRIRSGLIRIANGSLVKNVSCNRLFSYEQDRGDATHCGDVGFTNRIEVLDSTLSDLKGMGAVAILYQASWYPAVFRMANSTLTDCAFGYGVKMNDQEGSARDDGGYYPPELYLESGTSITGNTFSTAAVGISPKNEGCKVDFSGNLTICDNGKDVVFENRFDTLSIHEGVTGEIRVTAPVGSGVQFAIDGGATDFSAFKVTGDDSMSAFSQDGKVVWFPRTCIRVDGRLYASFAEADRLLRAQGKYIFMEDGAYVSRKLEEVEDGQLRYVAIGDAVMSETEAAKSFAFRVSDAATNAWVGCETVTDAAVAAAGKNGCVVELLKDVAPASTFNPNSDAAGRGTHLALCGAGHVWRMTELDVKQPVIMNNWCKTVTIDIIFDGAGVTRKAPIIRGNGGSAFEIVLDHGTLVRNFTLDDADSALPWLFFVAGQSGPGLIRMKEGAMLADCHAAYNSDLFGYNEATGDGWGTSCLLEGGIIRSCTARAVFTTSNVSKELLLNDIVITNNVFTSAVAVQQADGHRVSVAGRPVIRDNTLQSGGASGLLVPHSSSFVQTGDVLEGATVTIQTAERPLLGGAFGLWESGSGAEAFHPTSKPEWFGLVDDGKLVWTKKKLGLILIFR